MSELTERLRRRAETLDALSDPDLPPATIGTLAWKLEARLAMRNAAKDSNEAADEIERLNAQLAEARDAALEDAAKVAERFEAEYASERDKHIHGTPDHWMNNSGSYAAMDIAAAIRALKGKT